MLSDFENKRRQSDKNFMKRLWEGYAIYFHMIGFAILVVFMTGSYWSKWQAQGATIDSHERRITQLEYQSGQILQSLNDIKFYLKIPERGDNK